MGTNNMNLLRERAIVENIDFFENAFQSLAARHFFIEAARCAGPEPRLSLAGLTCLICGIEGALRFSLNERENQQKHDETHDLDGGDNFNNSLIRKAYKQVFDIEVFAFDEEKGRMKEIVASNKPPAGLVMWRNEFAHGRAYRTAEKIGNDVFSDAFMMQPVFSALFDLSYKFAHELAEFRGMHLSLGSPTNPFSD